MRQGRRRSFPGGQPRPVAAVHIESDRLQSYATRLNDMNLPRPIRRLAKQMLQRCLATFGYTIARLTSEAPVNTATGATLPIPPPHRPAHFFDATEDPPILTQAKDNYRTSSLEPRHVLPPLGRRWSGLTERLAQHIPKFETVTAAIRAAQRMDFGFESRRPAAYVKSLADYFEERLRMEYPAFAASLAEFSDTPLADPDTTIEHRGRLVSFPFYTQLRFVLTNLAHLHDLDLICEIGGGTGGPARLWLANPIRPPRTYVIIDVPESLFFSEVFLAKHFGASAVYYHTAADRLSQRSLERYRAVLVPVSRLDSLADIRFDLIINTLSMQEMSEEWVDLYMRWLDRQACRFFYSLNYFAQPLDRMVEGGNTWSPRLSRNWTARLLQFNSQRSGRNFAEIIAEKTDAPWSGDGSWQRLSDRFLTGQTYLELIDYVRATGQERLVLELLRRTLKEFPYVPQELWSLGRFLSTEAECPIYEAHRAEIDAINRQLAEIRNRGAEGAF